MTTSCICNAHELGHVDSLTDQEILDRQFEHMQRMEDITITLGGVCHHFNNQLATILGYLALTRQIADAQHDTAMAQYLDKMHLSAEQMKTLVAQLRQFCSEQQPFGQPQTQSIFLNEVLSASQVMFSEAVNKEIDLSIDIAVEPLWVNSDKAQVQQMVLALLNNAVRACGRNGRISIALSSRRFSNTPCDSCHQLVNGKYAELCVSDNGVGIAPEHRRQLFMPFFTTEKFVGRTGMGLSVLHGILHRQNGHVMLHSKPGKGSCFRLLLPITQHSTELVGGSIQNCTSKGA